MLGYKGFYGTKNENVVESYYFSLYEIGKKYKTTGDLKFGRYGGNGFHFCEHPDDTMPYFYASWGCDDFKLGIIETSSNIIQSSEKWWQYVTDEFVLKKIFTHNELIQLIKQYEPIRRSCNMLSYYNKNMSVGEIKDMLTYYEYQLKNYLSESIIREEQIFCCYKSILTLKKRIIYSMDKVDFDEISKLNFFESEWYLSSESSENIKEFIKKYIKGV